MIAIIVGYLGMSFLTCGGVMAYFQNQDAPMVLALRMHHYAKYYRSDLAFACAIALNPAGWITAPFLTGFYEHGWRILPAKEGKA